MEQIPRSTERISYVNNESNEQEFFTRVSDSRPIRTYGSHERLCVSAFREIMLMESIINASEVELI